MLSVAFTMRCHAFPPDRFQTQFLREPYWMDKTGWFLSSSSSKSFPTTSVTGTRLPSLDLLECVHIKHRLNRCSIRSWVLPLCYIWKDIQQGHCEGPARLESKKWWILRNSAKASYIESSSRRRPHSSDHFCNCLCQTRQSHDDALFQAKGSTS